LDFSCPNDQATIELPHRESKRLLIPKTYSTCDSAQDDQQVLDHICGMNGSIFDLGVVCVFDAVLQAFIPSQYVNVNYVCTILFSIARVYKIIYTTFICLYTNLTYSYMHLLVQNICARVYALMCTCIYAIEINCFPITIITISIVLSCKVYHYIVSLPTILIFVIFVWCAFGKYSRV